MIGVVIGNFRIAQRLGRGAMGEVFLAEQTNIGTKAAIKVLRAELSEERAQVQRFFNEAVAVSKIKHAGIVKIFDVGFHTNGQAYLLMELLEGETLAGRLEKQPKLPLARAFDFARQIAQILDATHAAGIVHRDLKPDNVFLVPDAELPHGERVKILDFGIAKLGNATTITGTGGSLGTPAYMAPEQWKNSKTVDARADIYALGCVAFQMACGRPPFIAESVGEACLMHMSSEPPLARSIVPEIPPAFEALLGRMLEKDAAARPTLREVIAVIDGKPLPARTIASDDTHPAMPVSHDSERGAAGTTGGRGVGRTGGERTADDGRSLDQTMAGEPSPPPRADADRADRGAPAPRSRLPVIAAVIGTLAIGGGIAAFALRGNATVTPPIDAATAIVDAHVAPADTAPLVIPPLDPFLANQKALYPRGDLAPLYAKSAFGFSPAAPELDGAQLASAVRADIKSTAAASIAQQRTGQDADIAWSYQDVTIGDRRYAITQVMQAGDGAWSIRLQHRATPLADGVAYKLAQTGDLPDPSTFSANTHGDDALAARIRAMFASRDAFVAALSDRKDAINIGSAGESIFGGPKIINTFKNWSVAIASTGEVVSMRLSPRAVIAILNVDLTIAKFREGFRVSILTLDDKIVLVQWSNVARGRSAD